MEQFQEYVDVQGLTTTFVQWLPQFLVGLLMIAAFVIGSFLVRKPLTAALKRSGVAEALIHLLIDKLFHYTLLEFGLVMALEIPFPHLQLFVEDVKDPAAKQLAQVRALPGPDED